MTKFLIVNADDYGWDRDINSACQVLASRGSLTSVSAMAGRIDSLDGCSFEAKEGRVVSVGVHLNISTGKPVAYRTQSSPLVDVNTGEFKRINLNNLSSLFLSLKKTDIAQEFDAQIETVMSKAGRVSHLDTHHHVARLPTIALEVADAARRHGISRVRTPRSAVGGSVSFHRRLIISWNQRIYKSHELNFPSVRFGMPQVSNWDEFEVRFRRYASNVAWPDQCIAELSCHPSLGGGVLNQSAEMEQRRRSDFSILSDERFSNLLSELNIEKASYYDF